MKNLNNIPEMNWTFEEGRIFCVDENNAVLAETTYISGEDGSVEIDHTYVNPELRGMGIAGKMMKVVADYFSQNGRMMSATCWYAGDWLQKHQEYQSAVITKQESVIACKIDGKH